MASNEIGKRIEMARRAAGMSQRALAEAAGLSAMAISKYERGLVVPGSEALLRLAKALDMRVEYFLRPLSVTLSAPVYRKRTALPKKQEAMILGQVQDWLERYLEVESLFGEPAEFRYPRGFPRQVNTMDEVEQAALDLRLAWSLGQDPFENLVEALEDRGMRVGLVQGHDAFDALTFRTDELGPVIALKSDLPGDRQRFNLAHELGHMLLEPVDLDSENAANRFAAAFLVPAAAALFELGERRSELGMYELHLLKHKYGLSMQAWIYRARDLGIVSEATFRQLNQRFRQNGWHRREPGDQIPPEEPGRMKRLVLRALAEELVSPSRAAELLGAPLQEFIQREAEQHGGLALGMRG
jgi:Zn-dependent peptidase ImmA (M78 family)/DNA-binding XRE family transcriptional regulator